MNQFVPYFLGEESPPYRRATSVQKSVRTGDIEIVGHDHPAPHLLRDARQLQLRRLLQGRRDHAWRGSCRPRCSATTATASGPRSTSTTTRPSRSGATPSACHAERMQRLGDEDNFWEMQKGAPGPCGPNSELYYDRGPDVRRRGRPGPRRRPSATSSSGTSCSCSSTGEPDGSLADLPSKNVDTGAGFERNLVLLQDVATVFETDALAPLRRDGPAADRHALRRRDERADVSLRIMADHARTVSFLVSDGVFPSNEGRGYVLRRLIRRAVRHAYLLGVEQLGDTGRSSTPRSRSWARPTPSSPKNRDVRPRRRRRARRSGSAQTLKAGTNILDVELGQAACGRGAARPGRVPAARHPRLPARAHPGDRGRARRRASTTKASPPRWPSRAGGPRRRASARA